VDLGVGGLGGATVTGWLVLGVGAHLMAAAFGARSNMSMLVQRGSRPARPPKWGLGA